MKRRLKEERKEEREEGKKGGRKLCILFLSIIIHPKTINIFFLYPFTQ